MANLIEAKAIVLEAIELAQLPQSAYGRLWKMLVNEYRDLNLYAINNVKFSKVAMDNNKIIYYPDDMVKLIAVYVPYNGEMVKLTKRRLVPTTSLTNGVVNRNVEDGENEPVSIEIRGRGAVPHNPFGYYYDYKHERYLAFVTESRTEVVLGYQTSGMSSQDTLIPVECKNALLWGIIYKDTLMSKNPQWKTQDVYRLHQDELDKLRKIDFDYELFADSWLNPNQVTR